MTRDELYMELQNCVGPHEAMPHIDRYAAAQRSEIEQQIAEHVRTRLVADRERIAQAIEAEVPKSVSDSWTGGLELAAEIARAEQ